MLPRILRLCTNKNQKVQKDAIICLDKIYGVLDKTTIRTMVLPAVLKMRKTA